MLSWIEGIVSCTHSSGIHLEIFFFVDVLCTHSRCVCKHQRPLNHSSFSTSSSSSWEPKLEPRPSDFSLFLIPEHKQSENFSAGSSVHLPEKVYCLQLLTYLHKPDQKMVDQVIDPQSFKVLKRESGARYRHIQGRLLGGYILQVLLLFHCPTSERQANSAHFESENQWISDNFSPKIPLLMYDRT